MGWLRRERMRRLGARDDFRLWLHRRLDAAADLQQAEQRRLGRLERHDPSRPARPHSRRRRDRQLIRHTGRHSADAEPLGLWPIGLVHGHEFEIDAVIHEEA